MNINDAENTIINILKNNNVKPDSANNGFMRFSVVPKSTFYNGLKHYIFELLNYNKNTRYITQIIFEVKSGIIYIFMKG